MKTALIITMILCISGEIIHPLRAYAQTENALDNLSLEDVLNMDISVAAQRSSTLRESPGIVSLITQEDIKNSGAQDLIDVLRLVPGFDFNPDVQNFLGISIRGNWANEGKVLVMMDGMPLNDLMFGCVPFGNRVPLALIDRIEIIRGPGSAQYGGIAMLGVVNIMTKGAKQLKGIEINASAGQFGSLAAQRNLSISAGREFAGANVALSAYIGSALRGEGVFTDYTGEQFSLSNYAKLQSKGINVSVSTGTTSMRMMLDYYAIGNRDARITENFDLGFSSIYAEVKHQEDFGAGFSLTPRVAFLRQVPWQVDIEQAKEAGIYYNRTIQRTTGAINFLYTMVDNFSVTGGIEYFNDLGITPEDTREISYFGTDTLSRKTHLSFNTIAVFMQALYNNPIANITLGARYENNTSFYGAFTPRIAITKQIGRFHAKALFSRAFHSPMIENLSLNATIQPEHGNIAEIEAGYQLGDNLFLRANGFSITIDNPIIYTYDGVFGTYNNAHHTGSYGIEGEVQYKTNALSCVIGYSTYTRWAEDLENYIVAGEDEEHIGIPDYKITLNTTFRMYDGIWITFSAVGMGERFGYAYNNETQERELQHFTPKVLANATMRAENIFSTGIDARIGCYNMFNVKNSFVAAYSSPDAQVFPIPDIPAMVQLQLNYHFTTE